MSRRSGSPRRLLIVSHVEHYANGGRLHAYGPYAREIDIWADLFPEVVIAAPRRTSPAPADALPFTRTNIVMHPLPETGGTSWRAKVHQLLLLPRLTLALARGIRAADALHVRCPGNVGLLGVLLGPLFGVPRVAKYAGQWNGYRGEAWTVRLQRRLLRGWWRAPVTVYGEWPDQPAHIVPFFTSMMTGEQVRAAADVAATKTLGAPLRVLFAGRLAPEKRVGVLVEAAKLAADRGVALELVIVGDGPERAALTDQVQRLDLTSRVRFVGAVPFDAAMHWYRWAHCLVLPSVHSEGWPKVIAEAMCHGVLCVAVDHGQVARMVRGRGVLLQHGSAGEIAEALIAAASQPVEFAARMQAASQWARQYSLESLRTALAGLLSERWRVQVGAAAFETTRAEVRV